MLHKADIENTARHPYDSGDPEKLNFPKEAVNGTHSSSNSRPSNYNTNSNSEDGIITKTKNQAKMKISDSPEQTNDSIREK